MMSKEKGPVATPGRPRTPEPGTEPRHYSESTIANGPTNEATAEGAIPAPVFPAPGSYRTIQLGTLEANVFVSNTSDDVHCLTFTTYSTHGENGRYSSYTMQLPSADLAALAKLLAEAVRS
jgi:hypothetical protein